MYNKVKWNKNTTGKSGSLCTMWEERVLISETGNSQVLEIYCQLAGLYNSEITSMDRCPKQSQQTKDRSEEIKSYL